ncbi:MAG: DUF6111 family protein [Hyphomicrobiales bacterium]|nr:DUF6111 family protein [Hyphomicrobiales bacterium]
MLRVLLINLFMFFLPFLVYAAYVFLVRRGQSPDSVLRGAPIKWLVVSGLALALATLISLVTFTGERKEGTYHPPRFEDGVIKPGRVE